MCGQTRSARPAKSVILDGTVIILMIASCSIWFPLGLYWISGCPAATENSRTKRLLCRSAQCRHIHLLPLDELRGMEIRDRFGSEQGLLSVNHKAILPLYYSLVIVTRKWEKHCLANFHLLCKRLIFLRDFSSCRIYEDISERMSFQTFSPWPKENIFIVFSWKYHSVMSLKTAVIQMWTHGKFGPWFRITVGSRNP